MHFSQRDVFGDINIGMYLCVTDKHCLTGHLSKKISHDCKTMLKIDTMEARLLSTGFAGIYCKGNSHGFVLPKVVKHFGGSELEKCVDVAYIDTRYCALGNLILMNDNGILISPLLAKVKQDIEKFFGLKCVSTKIADTIIVGKAGVATNKGCLLHRDATPEQLKLAEDVLGVSADIGTINFGSPYVGAGLIANSHGFIASTRASGPEMGRIEEALGFL